MVTIIATAITTKTFIVPIKCRHCSKLFAYNTHSFNSHNNLT